MIQPAAAPAPAPNGPAPAEIAAARNHAIVRTGARWFYLIAGLSLINSFLFVIGSKVTFLIGLGITDAANAIAQSSASDGSGMVYGLIFDVVAAGGFIGLAYMAEKRVQWAFLTGMIVYALDAALLVWAQDWLSVGFHGLALFYLWRGWQACRWLTQFQPIAPAAPPGMAPPIIPR